MKEGWFIQSFCKDVHDVILCANQIESDSAVSDMLSEMMILLCMQGAWCEGASLVP